MRILHKISLPASALLYHLVIRKPDNQSGSVRLPMHSSLVLQLIDTMRERLPTNTARKRPLAGMPSHVDAQIVIRSTLVRTIRASEITHIRMPSHMRVEVRSSLEAFAAYVACMVPYIEVNAVNVRP